jgi:ABC-type antimicrobial peptide transport system permease subunit
VSRRVREFGTLKALGWRTRRVVGQVMGEALAMCTAPGFVETRFPLLADLVVV